MKTGDSVDFSLATAWIIGKAGPHDMARLQLLGKDRFRKSKSN
jgi:hypothetical protein